LKEKLNFLESKSQNQGFELYQKSVRILNS